MRAAAYVRYSSDAQREASLEDQLRNIRKWCARHDIADPAVYSDAAISGARDDRPGYRSLLSEVTSGHFDLLLVDDLSRLSRDSTETGRVIKRLKFAGVRLVGVSDGVDTSRKGHKIDVGLRGLMSELYLDDLAEKTHRGLTGRALAGASAGGLPYGFRVPGTGQREVDEAQAAVVRRIYDLAGAGHSARAIAAKLNAEGVPSARGGDWCMTAIYGDHRRGIGILANPIYLGRQIWNRSRWEKHPETGRRIRAERPEAEWIITEHPELAIVTQAQWDAVQNATRRHPSYQRAAGRSPKHLLSGLLQCADCGGPMVVVDRYRYGCARAKDRGPAVCASRLRVARQAAEDAILAGLREQLLSETAYKEFERQARSAIAEAAPDTGMVERALRDAERTRENILAALRAGIITPSTRAELITAEHAVDAAKRALRGAQAYQPSQILPRARETWRRLVAQLADIRDLPEARAAVSEAIGGQLVLRETSPGVVVAETSPTCQINVVAGAGFVRSLTQSFAIPIPVRPIKPGRAS